MRTLGQQSLGFLEVFSVHEAGFSWLSQFVLLCIPRQTLRTLFTIASSSASDRQARFCGQVDGRCTHHGSRPTPFSCPS